MEQYAKLTDNGTLECTCASTNVEKNKLITEGFLPYVILDPPIADLLEFQRWGAKHRNDGAQITTYFEVVCNDSDLINKRIAELSAQLSASDYKVVKNHEYIDAGQPPYYDPIELYNEREPIRQQIRDLENLLNG